MTAIWPYMPQTGITESLEWYTDVIRCKASEQRLCIRPVPRQEFALGHHFDAATLAAARDLARSIGADECYLPIWTERAEVGALTAHTVTLPVDPAGDCYKVGGKVLVWDAADDCEVCTIQSLTGGIITLDPWVVNAYSNAVVAPVRLATLAQEFEADRDVYTLTEAHARFVAVDTEDISALAEPTLPVHRTIQVLTDRVALVSSIRDTQLREVDIFDCPSGPVIRTPIYSAATQTTSVAWRLLDRESLWALRVWLHQQKGRWKCFWLPSWNADVTVTKTIAASDTEIEVLSTPYVQALTCPADFMILTTLGGFQTFRVESVAAGGTGKKLLQLEDAWDSTLALQYIALTSRMTLSRFDSDRIEIRHDPAGMSKVVVPVTEVPEDAEVPT